MIKIIFVRPLGGSTRVERYMTNDVESIQKTLSRSMHCQAVAKMPC